MNRLQFETSPYLLQHAHNPVDWYAWKPEAFERARAEQKPILVSIGYSTCHWCHVMEREAFENEEIAAYMNENFINIKVDREERPDVDAIYMEACQMLTGSGGWPLNCFLTPETKPFYAGTYFPPKPAYNRPSWIQLLEHLTNIWETQREVAIAQSEKLLANIQRNDGVFLNPLSPEVSGQSTSGFPDPEAIYSKLKSQFDLAEGGFGGAPKFPSTMAIQWLMNWHKLSGNPEALTHALFSLEKMAGGGIYDQIGGGFARYATDREWLIPHFEKMLYDNALLISVLSEAHKLESSGGADVFPLPKNHWAGIIEQTLEYIEREMTNAEGAFYAAQDADSEGVEGKFYVWDKTEIDQILGLDAPLFCAFYGVTETGNWEGHNILWRPNPYGQFATEQNISVTELQEKLRESAEKLLQVRSKRIWPGLDHKILLGWNALMVSAYASAFSALGHEKYRQAAIRNLDYLQQNFRYPAESNQNPVAWRHSASQAHAFLDDYAYLVAAFLDVYQVTFEKKYLEMAEACTNYVRSNFFDPSTSTFFFTDIAQTDILFRKKDLYDSATPSGNSTMVHNLQRLGLLLDQPEWLDTASNMLSVIRETLGKYPLSFQRWATASLNEKYPLQEIAIIGENAVEKALEIQRSFLPNKVIVASAKSDNSIPLLAGKEGAQDALIYVCRNFACQRPVSSLDEFWDLVNS